MTKKGKNQKLLKKRDVRCELIFPRIRSRILSGYTTPVSRRAASYLGSGIITGTGSTCYTD